MRIKILTVDTSVPVIQGLGKDGGIYSISATDISPVFTWPKINEYWMIYQENNFWSLGGRAEDVDDTIKTTDLQPGETLIQGDKVHFKTGTIYGDGYLVTRKAIATVTHNGVTLTYLVQHNLDTSDIVAKVYKNGVEQTNVFATIINTAQFNLTWPVSAPNGTNFRVVIIG